MMMFFLLVIVTIFQISLSILKVNNHFKMSQPSEITELTSTTSESDVSSYFERVETGVKCIFCKEKWGSLTATTKKAHLSN